MKQKMMVGLMTAVFLLSSTLVLAETPPKDRSPKSGEEKSIIISSKEKPLTLETTSPKKTYEVNEPITFSVKTNKEAYLYVFTLSDRGDQAFLIFPSDQDKNNRVAANKALTIPSKGEFVSPRAGAEKVIFLASTKEITLAVQKSLSGKYSEMPKSALDKQIRLVPAAEPEKAVKIQELTITGKSEAEAPAPSWLTSPTERAAKPIVFVNTDKFSYKVNEPINIRCTADTTGTVDFYIINPDKTIKPLKKKKVEKGQIVTLSGSAEEPKGLHQVVAVFYKTAEDSKSAEGFVKNLANPGIKGFRLMEDPESYTLSTFVIE